MTKIIIKEEGKEKKVFNTDTFFLLTDKGATWNGVDTHLSKMLELYAEKIIQKRKENMYANSK